MFHHFVEGSCPVVFITTGPDLSGLGFTVHGRESFTKAQCGVLSVSVYARLEL
jgi:hypothetical protein